eukprot:CAMPEP_0202690638 /NCGR_PEP_ID=MMETSP1385-20130828/5565_1 /ASSEMBLY_ACC=CAM_ASM_000861 /TAXON_ID=933848 /ORGANISM="Elphidium margaritaceum" /LENGTH=384 /DNA_ID=CAMNT_0049345919 /DNA_START=25 /DNA_END=1179 /DNA_ORIENTATION=-
MATNYDSPFTFSSSPYENPFSNKRNDADTMEEDEDDDLKINAENELMASSSSATDVVLTTRQRKIAKFKQLQSKKKTAAGESKSFTTASAKRGAQQRSNSLPRSIINDDDNDDDDDIKQQPSQSKDDYIFFGQTSAPSTSGPAAEQERKQQQSMDALNLEMSSSLHGNNKKSKKDFDALSKRADVASVEVHTMSYRSVRVPGHRMVHVRKMWKEICDPVVKQLKLQIRMNSKKNVVELRMVNTGDAAQSQIEDRKHKNVIQKGSDFIRAVVIGFEIRDALALVRMDDIYLETFDIRDVKFFNKKSDHWMRAIGRIAGQYGKIKYSIENSTNTRIVIFGFKVYILGSFSSIRLARNAISRLIMGSAPGNVYAKLRVVSNRVKHKF